MDHKFNYLALGDSYTIGEMVLLADNFPNEVVRILSEKGFDIHPPRIIAKTGWTTGELSEGILEAGKNELLLPAYDFVTLLIGVNNQYRGLSTEAYKNEFETLLQHAIAFAAGKPERVVVLSIPDWGVTPYANGRDRKQIASEIDLFNSINKKITHSYRVHYIDITPWTREAADDPTLLAPDGLHPSGKEYRRWAQKVAAFFESKAGSQG